METRNWSIDAYNELMLITTYDEEKRADSLLKWNQKYLEKYNIKDLDLEKNDLLKFQEYFYMNINFLKNYKNKTKTELETVSKLKKFLKH